MQRLQSSGLCRAIACSATTTGLLWRAPRCTDLALPRRSDKMKLWVLQFEGCGYSDKGLNCPGTDLLTTDLAVFARANLPKSLPGRRECDFPDGCPSASSAPESTRRQSLGGTELYAISADVQKRGCDSCHEGFALGIQWHASTSKPFFQYPRTLTGNRMGFCACVRRLMVAARLVSTP